MNATPEPKREHLEKPSWLKIRASNTERFSQVRNVLKEERVDTVCDASHCPNISECWSHHSATFLILGRICTRSCRFCAVQGNRIGEEIDDEEASRIAKAVDRLDLNYVVITSVTRDDLWDFGAEHFSNVVRQIRCENPYTEIELLIPDFQGCRDSIATVARSKPCVMGHNLETVRRLQAETRDPKANYDQSLSVLETIKEIDSKIYTKSSLMLGLGESRREILETMKDIRNAGVDMLTLGQYLRPKDTNIEVREFVSPEDFEDLRKEALALGFRHVAAGPFVRSSYRAFEFVDLQKGG
ncbi:MAG: lipoyl synthase [Methanomassiliicoccales archaeon]|nr:lipoyl synthase [Methanomassiliicoccales archaeon]